MTRIRYGRLATGARFDSGSQRRTRAGIGLRLGPRKTSNVSAKGVNMNQ